MIVAEVPFFVECMAMSKTIVIEVFVDLVMEYTVVVEIFFGMQSVVPIIVDIPTIVLISLVALKIFLVVVDTSHVCQVDFDYVVS